MNNTTLNNTIFNNAVVWITGASSGIGEALAREFSKQGAKLILTARRKDRLEKLAQELGTEKTKILPLDLENFSQAEEWVTAALSFFGTIDVLVNNAGVSQRALSEKMPFSLDQKMVNVDLLSPIALTKALLPHFISKKSGRIIVTSSLMAYLELPGNASYACVKHGINGYFYSLRYELKKYNILVQVLEPGFVKTEVTLNALTASGKPYAKMESTHANAMSAEKFSKKAMKAILSGKVEIQIAGKERLAVWVKRFFPCVYRWLIETLFSKVLKDRVS